MIGSSIKVKGDITGDENLVVEGEVEGQIHLTNHDLSVGETGKVTADIKAKTVHIHGQVHGDIDGTELVVISKTGKVLGNIVAPRVTLEDGAHFKGSIDMTTADNKASPASKGPKVAESNPPKSDDGHAVA